MEHFGRIKVLYVNRCCLELKVLVTVFLDNVVTELDPPLLKKLLETNLLQIILNKKQPIRFMIKNFKLLFTPLETSL